ncbi:cytochrome b/b6 domain-containing protein [Elstera cyanobacteriorum]|uniref:cytochrome b/b6 domain-containing protein n=1 Tax=Elstera cyanobacteriorum TaxID=2022747 RepID=UPI00235444F2|nr:cytochrome b/b6 domain-containing protein [Elstera cyanobacteriorum]MCK6444025.1 cytochrome b/b6 domain-containing protein [Elstera cyanobacteriorum]
MSAPLRAAASEVPVWDLGVRLFHWGTVAAVATAFLAEEGESLHEKAGYVAAALLGFRLIWGLIGTRHARFSDFVAGPGKVFTYLLDRVRGRAPHYLGHNPAGGAMILVLLTLLATVAGTGVAMTSDALWGNHLVEEIHETAANALLVCIGIHVAAVILMSKLDKENLVKAMITGKKRRQP